MLYTAASSRGGTRRLLQLAPLLTDRPQSHSIIHVERKMTPGKRVEYFWLLGTCKSWALPFPLPRFTTHFKDIIDFTGFIHVSKFCKLSVSAVWIYIQWSVLHYVHDLTFYCNCAIFLGLKGRERHIFPMRSVSNVCLQSEHSCGC